MSEVEDKPDKIVRTLHWLADKHMQPDVYLTTKIGEEFQESAVTEAYLKLVSAQAASSTARDIALAGMLLLIVLMTGENYDANAKLRVVVSGMALYLLIRAGADQFGLWWARAKLSAARGSRKNKA